LLFFHCLPVLDRRVICNLTMLPECLVQGPV
jgi:hypothetical protein